ncbi:hypothetical protein Fleli_3479 [Bernardetia litoralis DSM 6794]|uniref:Uncharacterized protein n=1 Tax=Bernardetia litoralis (strain ATCC 23117 / DSM 6794 / NBRC 15988 / NCIMB 1366 / Fx l1 / Sio-4) TaxID=880071 RepID=I4APB4_BERLS|nr:hypothetical protein Fleli_3479 [Bernardetia litoralis DSM 6794]
MLDLYIFYFVFMKYTIIKIQCFDALFFINKKILLTYQFGKRMSNYYVLRVFIKKY